MKICNLKIDVSCAASVNCQHIPHLPRLPRNLHLVATGRSPANAIDKKLRLPRKMTMDTSKVLHLPRKMQRIFWKRRKSIAPATQNDFRHVTEQVWMSRSATPATRNEATRRLKHPKRTTPAELTIGTAIRSSHERLRPQTQRRANTPSTPRPPEWNGNPCYAFGKKAHSVMDQQVSKWTCDGQNEMLHLIFRYFLQAASTHVQFQYQIWKNSKNCDEASNPKSVSGKSKYRKPKTSYLLRSNKSNVSCYDICLEQIQGLF